MKKYSTDSKFLSLLGLTLVSGAGCTEQFKPIDETPHLFLTKTEQNQCLSQKLCSLGYGQEGCDDRMAQAVPVFESAEDCKEAFRGTSYTVTCEEQSFSSYQEEECSEEEKKIVVEYDDEGEDKSVQEDTVKVASCQTTKGEQVIQKMFLPHEKGFFSDNHFTGREALYRWFGGKDLSKFEVTKEGRDKGFSSAVKPMGYYLPGELKLSNSSEDLALFKASISSCDSSGEVSEILAAIEQSKDPSKADEAMKTSQNNYQQSQVQHSSGGNMFMWWWMMSSMNRGGGAGYLNRPSYLNGSGMGFNQTTRFTNFADRGQVRPSPFYSRANGSVSSLSADSVSQGKANMAHLNSHSSVNSSGKTVVKSSSFRASPSKSAGFGKVGASRSSYGG